MTFCYTHRSALCSAIIRGFLLQQAGINTETHISVLYREQETLKHSALNGMSLPYPSPWESGNPKEEEAERV